MSHTTVIARTIIKVTARAVLIRTEENDELWIPRSVIHESDDYAEGDDDVELNVADWWAKKEGL